VTYQAIEQLAPAVRREARVPACGERARRRAAAEAAAAAPAVAGDVERLGERCLLRAGERVVDVRRSGAVGRDPLEVVSLPRAGVVTRS